MFPSSSPFPSIPRVSAPTTAADIVIEVVDGSSVGRDGEGEALPPYSLWNYIVAFGRQLNSRRFRLMHFGSDRLKVREKNGMARDSAVCAWPRRWNRWGFRVRLFFV